MYACWSVKGGSGTTVFAAALSLAIAEKRGRATLVDLGGDVPAVLGMEEGSGLGIRDWLAGPTRDPDAYTALRRAATSKLDIISVGNASSFSADALDDLRAVADGNTIIDFGTLRPSDTFRGDITADWLVTRPCYLSLRRAARLEQRPRGVVVLREAGRALTRRDIESVTGAPVIAEISVSDAIARSVDAGLLATRLPKRLGDEIESLLS